MSNQFNKHIKDHVERHEYDIDPQEIWDGILAKEKPDSRGYFWMFLFPIAIGFLAISTWLSHETLNSGSSLSNTTESKQPKLSEQNEDNIRSTVSLSQEINSSETKSYNQKETTTSKAVSYTHLTLPTTPYV